MRFQMLLRGMSGVLFAALLAGGWSFLRAAEGAVKIELIENPKFRPPAPAQRGKEYRMNWSAEGLERNPIILGWRVDLPDGSGLAFGGLSMRTEDPRPATNVKRGGSWVDIREELRKKNPLQPFVEQIMQLHRLARDIASRSRHIYLEGRDEAAEKAFFDKEIAPKIAELAAKVRTVREALSKAGGTDKYLAGQAACSLGHLDKVFPAFEALGSRTEHAKLLALRQSRIRLEQAAEVLDAEPPARGLSMLAYDAKSSSIVCFGGDHFDYQTNDLWVFDLKAQRWEQKHPKGAPEPRAGHLFESMGDGKFKMVGGFVYPRPLPGWDNYFAVHAGPEEWTYDLGSNTWQGPASAQLVSSDTRAYRQSGPDGYTDGPRPNAAAHAKMLEGLPANGWVDLSPPKRPWGRDWGTMAYDPDRDMIYWYSGGHCVYSGADVLHYHIATNRWDQLVDTEMASGYYGGGESVPGWTFNRRAWICGHSWNSYGYNPALRKMIVNGRQGLNNKYFDQHTYVYDPDLGDWAERKATARHFDVYSTQVRFVPGLGMLTWYGTELWKLDDKTLKWEPLTYKGKLAGSRCDFSGLVYDAKRKRELFFSGGTYQGEPYSGEVFALDAGSLEATSFKPEGSEHIRALYAGQENILGVWVLREVAYHPGMDLFLFGSKLPGGYMVALDAKSNRWVGLKISGAYPFGLSAGLAYDAKRDLFFALGAYGEAFALRLDPKSVIVKTFAEIAAEAGAGKKLGK